MVHEARDATLSLRVQVPNCSDGNRVNQLTGSNPTVRPQHFPAHGLNRTLFQPICKMRGESVNMTEHGLNPRDENATLFYTVLFRMPYLSSVILCYVM